MRAVLLAGLTVVHLPMMGIHPTILQAPVLGECSASTATTTLFPKCGNMLPLGWESSKTPAQVLALYGELAKMKTRDNKVVTRLTKSNCRYTPGGLTIEISESLRRPVAMDSFPTRGSNGTDLVVSFIDVVKQSGCGDLKYGSQQLTATRDRKIVHFITVNANAPSVSGAVGRWRSWTLTYDKGSGEIGLLLAASGTYKKCQHEHSDSWSTYNWFMSCESNKKASEFARKQKLASASVGALLDAYSKPEKGLAAFAAFGWDSYTEPVWGRCGNLGCCAAE